ncbi:Phage integrase family protein [Paraoerskovia marina]|uniref:Phage integrase family protein n=1 Tax=Paraoerskovia marina TaxID=545619 RepID=A0A1H1SEL9_9CELL|nr:site-specific integrase [Paraoerskovia marina]SDS46427.1 Phage integrase family protein [Paraoerskovia marina]
MATPLRVHAETATTWTVVGPDRRVIETVEDYRELIPQSDYSQHTVRAYAKALAMWATFLEDRQRAWDAVVLADFGAFLRALRAGEIGAGVSALRPERVVSGATVAARLRPVMRFYQLHGAMGVPAPSFLYEQVNARSGRHLPFLEHVARRKGSRRSRLRVRTQMRDVPVLGPAAIDDLIAAEVAFDPVASASRLDDRAWGHNQRGDRPLSASARDQAREWFSAGVRRQPSRSLVRRLRVVAVRARRGCRRRRLGLGVHLLQRLPGADVGATARRERLRAPRADEAARAPGARRFDPALVSPHHATALLRAGTPLHVVSARLGHRSVQTTTNTYGHVTDDAVLAALANWHEVAAGWAARADG